MRTKHWRVAEPCAPNLSAVFALEHLPQDRAEIVAQLLWNRGLRSKDEAAAFLSPQWETHLHDPRLFRRMPEAVARIFRALESGERITVHGDYDADGITGTAVMITALRAIESRIASPASRDGDSRIDFYIPHREKEGYGLHRETVALLADRGTRLIVTVDCGIACVEEIAFAKRRSVDTVVVDHHQFGDALPDGHLIHPGLPDESYPFKKLAAVGVAFKCVCALLEEARSRGLPIPAGWEKWLLDLVAIATVTDMVPLTGENRLLETYGLRVLNKTRRLGLAALLESAGLSPGSLDTESIGFSIGPRLNAAGRMDHASLALRLLLSESEEEARALAAELERCNRERQEATKRMMAEAEAQLMERYASQEDRWPKALMLWDARWSPSLVGLVAGRFLERWHRPMAVVGAHEGTWIGSGRSFAAFDITEALRHAGEGMLARVGGHVQACGFSLGNGDSIPLIADRLGAYASSALSDDSLLPRLDIDKEIPLDAIDEELVAAVDRLAPFGEGNPRPVFLSRRVFVARADAVGATKNHLRMTVVGRGGRRFSAIGFKFGARAAEFPQGEYADIVYNVGVNEWQGRKELQCRLIDLRPAAIKNRGTSWAEDSNGQQ